MADLHDQQGHSAVFSAFVTLMSVQRKEPKSWLDMKVARPVSYLEEEQAELLAALRPELDPLRPKKISGPRREACLQLLTHLASGLEAQICSVQ